MHYALCDEATKKPMAMKLVCVGADERVVGLHVAIHPTASEEFVTMAPWGALPVLEGDATIKPVLPPTPPPAARL
ncbi:MAG: hypothetical protein SGPRY_010831 [Prymnesium sp.]